MTDKDELVDKLDAWLFNLRLECSGGSLSAIEEVAIGGAVLKLSDLLDVLESLTSERDKWRKLAAEANEALSRCLDHMDEHSSEPAFEAYQAGLAALTAFNTATGDSHE